MSKSWPEIVPDVRIPVPPFRDLDESKTFHRALAVHVAEIGRASGGPFAETLALCSVIASAGALQRSASSGDGATGAPDHPSAVVLGVALLTRLPVAWTPVSLVEAVRAWSSGGGMLWGSRPRRRSVTSATLSSRPAATPRVDGRLVSVSAA